MSNETPHDEGTELFDGDGDDLAYDYEEDYEIDFLLEQEENENVNPSEYACLSENHVQPQLELTKRPSSNEPTDLILIR